jgi:uroporphyrinogen decarboxylase
MTSKERVLRTIYRKETDRVPFDIEISGYGGNKWGRFFDYFDVNTEDEVLKRLNIDFRKCTYNLDFAAGAVGGTTFVNHWGVLKDRFGIALQHPLAGAYTIKDIEKHNKWPDPDEIDYKMMVDNMKKYKDFAVYGGCWGPILYVASELFGMEHLFILMYEMHDTVDYVLDKITDFYMEVNKRIFEKAGKDMQIFYMGDDYGTQNDLIISPNLWRRFIKPRLAKVFRLAEKYGYFIQLHSCGNIEKIIPDLIELGVAILNPVQPIAHGMNIRELKHKYGKQLCFNGSIDTQTVLPFGSVSDVQRYVHERLELFKNDGGFILAPSQGFLPEVPMKNIEAMYQAALY